MSDDQITPSSFDGDLYQDHTPVPVDESPATVDELLTEVQEGTLAPAPLTDADLEVERGVNRFREAGRAILATSPAVAIGAVILAFLAGSLMIVFTDPNVRAALGGEGNFFAAAGAAIADAYSRLIRGSIFDWTRSTWVEQIRPLTQTLNNATPLIAAGLGIAITFKAGLFNIGGRGQMIFGAIGAGWLAFGLRDAGIPFPVHMILCVLAGLLAAALWGALAGWLKAKTGAHEVIATIMLNFVAFYLLQYFLATPGLMQAPGRMDPITPAIPTSAQLPRLFGSSFPVDWGFVVALLLVALCWWILNRSTFGFQFRAVGENPRAARVAGINVARTTILVFALSGALVGFAGAQRVLGQLTSGFTDTIDGGIGFDAITVALLGGSNPIGVLFAGLLFGAFRAGATTMQAGPARIPLEIVSVIQALIVMFIAAPPLVRAIFRLPQPSLEAEARRAERKAARVAAKAANKEVLS